METRPCTVARAWRCISPLNPENTWLYSDSNASHWTRQKWVVHLRNTQEFFPCWSMFARKCNCEHCETTVKPQDEQGPCCDIALVYKFCFIECPQYAWMPLLFINNVLNLGSSVHIGTNYMWERYSSAPSLITVLCNVPRFFLAYHRVSWQTQVTSSYLLWLNSYLAWWYLCYERHSSGWPQRSFSVDALKQTVPICGNCSQTLKLRLQKPLVHYLKSVLFIQMNWPCHGRVKSTLGVECGRLGFFYWQKDMFNLWHRKFYQVCWKKYCCRSVILENRHFALLLSYVSITATT